MTFNDDADIRGGRVSRRGRNAAIGAGGGGLVVIALLIIGPLLGVDLSGLAPMLGGDGGGQQVEETPLDGCLTGEDANENVDCRMQGAATSLDLYWQTQVDGYAAPELILFDASVQTGCGNATSPATIPSAAMCTGSVLAQEAEGCSARCPPRHPGVTLEHDY